ncbi:MAG: DUF1559 domain-containing protein [Planctomycetaceae bacterium]|nr:DUF1559 domain-containing protein [Planctomycetaceae bacterium]
MSESLNEKQPKKSAPVSAVNGGRKPPFRIMNVVGLLFFLFVLATLILPARQRERHGPRHACQSTIRNIVLALTNYCSGKSGVLPPPYIADASGRPMHSWRVLLLPYLDQGDLYAKYRFDEPWDGPNNSKLHSIVVKVFQCPDDQKGGTPSTNTSYCAVIGDETAWPEDRSISLDQISKGDGLTNTLLVVEVANSGIHWMEPRDLHLQQMSPTINCKTGQGISSRHPGVVNAAFANGRVKPLSEQLPAATIRALLTVRGGETIGDDDF